MATTLKNIAPVALTATLVTQYTVPAATTAIIKEIIICNTDTAARVVTIHAIQSADVAAVANQIYADSVPAGATIILGLNTILAASGFVQAKAASASVVGFRMSAIEVT